MHKILISFTHGRGLVYDADDYLSLRCNYRIVGNLIGVPVSHPRNIHHQGLPAVLSVYEMKLLLDKNVVCLIDKTSALLTAPSGQQKELYNSMITVQNEELRQPAMNERLDTFRKHLPKVMEGKKQKLLKLGHNLQDIDITPEKLLDEEREKIKRGKFDSMVQLPTKHPFDAEMSVVAFVLTAEENAKYRVFQALWNEGGFITTGDAFGCDFLLYPGDPLYFHASHMVHVLKDGRRTLDVKNLTRMCRLAVVVNKLCVVGYVSEHSGEVHFETLEWEGCVNVQPVVGEK
ncbi:tRNA-splicing endonuclease subunit Sen34 [Anopheles bellator]|uniref:tRNA-splicing endonuclease subunit Sen34 n=1 Tax=Anopheles bellator TaxID=139047 RepID=UPI0026499F45|nr:tRNA-splicing endonuclease subunit Sen34 [Anopheles bellator]